MKKVKCINDKFEIDKYKGALKAILTVGERLPVKDEVYTVLSEYYSGYLLEGFDYSSYNVSVFFLADRFEVVEHKFTPNNVDKDGNLTEISQYIINTEIKF